MTAAEASIIRTEKAARSSAKMDILDAEKDSALIALSFINVYEPKLLISQESGYGWPRLPEEARR